MIRCLAETSRPEFCAALARDCGVPGLGDMGEGGLDAALHTWVARQAMRTSSMAGNLVELTGAELKAVLEAAS